MLYQYEYPRPAVAVDLVVVSRRPQLQIMLIQRLKDPFKDCWALPGGFLEIDETLERGAAREMLEETGLVVSEMKQFGAFSTVDRDPRGRVISIGFFAEIDSSQEAVAADDAKDAKWFDLMNLPSLAFDHAEMIAIALKKMINSAD